jgi:hypothetical protein
MLEGQTEDQELGQNDREDEGEIHPKRLSNYSIQENAEPEIEVDDSERIH